MAVSGTSGTSSTSSASTVTGAASGIANNFDQFLSLLTTQLKNQSPLDPLDTNQFTAQLVQFAGVEQQLRTNETLASLLSLSAAGTATNAVGFIGAVVTTDGATTRLANGKAEWNVTMPAAGTATITIKDAKGSVVQTQTRTFSAGDQSYAWDGSTSIGVQAPDGEYTITIDAKNIAGESITAKTQISGLVDGVDFTSSIPMLKIGSISVPIDKVKSVVRGE
ncbi:flagellar hook capping FlgD N-terminal domain-containing protein [Bosea sp. (in: a-proteobacteria)]|uniref:flagellar hook assembly protein FlgD n=1 Tax=Bosea sp. (in: a-proteobacteria) TaxID=1871050 RepID=UPI002616C42F|nr:flagellar hook capping FlgD N-terminal domain-containing protein [Bosea sp. (in: a-proteobacteria)]MCO5091555.1 flagellar hook assembly protein FlgD [Bosea sp. (in: a-proteobacteria)]